MSSDALMSTGIKKDVLASKPGGLVTHPAHDVLRSEQRPLDSLFAPQSVAVIGATEKAGSVGRNILRNLITSPFGGTVFPIHPGRPSVLGIKAYPSVAQVPEAVELAVIATPAPTVPGIVKDRAAPTAAGRDKRFGTVAVVVGCMLGPPAGGAALGTGWSTGLLATLAVACAVASIAAQRLGRRIEADHVQP